MIPESLDDLDRRTVLRRSGAGLAVAVTGLAGCAEPEDESEDPGTGDDPAGTDEPGGSPTETPTETDG
jgi:hypothetical protein